MDHHARTNNRTPSSSSTFNQSFALYEIRITLKSSIYILGMSVCRHLRSFPLFLWQTVPHIYACMYVYTLYYYTVRLAVCSFSSMFFFLLILFYFIFCVLPLLSPSIRRLRLALLISCYSRTFVCIPCNIRTIVVLFFFYIFVYDYMCIV